MVPYSVVGWANLVFPVVRLGQWIWFELNPSEQSIALSSGHVRLLTVLCFRELPIEALSLGTKELLVSCCGVGTIVWDSHVCGLSQLLRWFNMIVWCL